VIESCLMHVWLLVGKDGLPRGRIYMRRDHAEAHLEDARDEWPLLAPFRAERFAHAPEGGR
jgi:hypothetical protein